MDWKIVKLSRDPTAASSYAGPACSQAGVEPGRCYTSREEALEAAKKLSAVNPVGFGVYPCQQGEGS